MNGKYLLDTNVIIKLLNGEEKPIDEDLTLISFDKHFKNIKRLTCCPEMDKFKSVVFMGLGFLYDIRF